MPFRLISSLVNSRGGFGRVLCTGREWNEISARMPQDLFGREMFPMLVCRAVCYSRRLAGKLVEVEHGLDGLPCRRHREAHDMGDLKNSHDFVS